MPPAVSDDDSDVGIPDSIPARPVKKGNAKEEEEDDEEDEEDEEDEDEYQVERIMAHKTERNKIVYKVKWLGWDREEDMTWEPVDNLENAVEILEAYHRKIGGTPEPPAKGKGKGKRAASTSNAVDSPASGKKRARKSDTNGVKSEDKELPFGSWEDLCTVAAIIEEHEMPDASSTKKQKDDKSLLGMLQWTNGRKTQHPMKTLRTKCPQRVLDYYESHLLKLVANEDDS